MYLLKTKIYFKVSLFLFSSLGFSIACNNEIESSQKQDSNAGVSTAAVFSIPDTLQPGVLYNKVAINDDPLNSFALYLPKLYNNNISWPVVFFFDPGGKGSLPLINYHDLADSLGYVFIGSNVSKNGQDMEESMQMWNILKNSCLNNLSLDKQRIVLAGFSGGARVSLAIASKEPSISGIIANSAGAQQLEQIINNQTFFIGLSGKGDMNRAEMLGIEQHLQGTTLKHAYIEYDGIHEWAPSSIMKKALMLISMNSYIRSPSLLDAALVTDFMMNQKKTINELIVAGNFLDAYLEVQLLTKGTKGLVNENFDNLDSIKNAPAYVLQRNELLKLNALETENQQELLKLITENPDPLKWKLKIDAILKKSIQKNKVGQMNQRLLGYASLLSYSLSNRNLMAKNYVLAEKIINCYEIADPENAEVYYLRAIIAGNKKDSSSTKTYLKKSLALGFNDKPRIQQQPEFSFLKNDEIFNEILNNVQF